MPSTCSTTSSAPDSPPSTGVTRTDDLADLYAEDGLHEFPFGGLPPYAGREQIRAGYHAMWDSIGMEAQEVRRLALHRTQDPEVVVVEQDTHVTAGGQPITVPGLLVLRIGTVRSSTPGTTWTPAPSPACAPPPAEPVPGTRKEAAHTRHQGVSASFRRASCVK
ncbi:nuclear transport factor 2 family protein [Nonomuraea aridisoli]|uniref:nuclear transport factor 2 family protein n=1 Tax=Nonomuraea aridisoli TaxID=2070368 RepID=UPI0015E89470|nr:nuclear transport factor 2 family protein [Nonomuraea aridisoli]